MDARRPCTCTTRQIRSYMAKVSGPLLDRIDLHIEVPSVGSEAILGRREGLSSAAMREEIRRAREAQARRFAEDGAGRPGPGRLGAQHPPSPPGLRRTSAAPLLNAQMGSRHLRRWCALDEAGESLMRQAIDELGLSARAYTRILKVSRTIADLEGETAISLAHVSEAVQYRSLDRAPMRS